MRSMAERHGNITLMRSTAEVITAALSVIKNHPLNDFERAGLMAAVTMATGRIDEHAEYLEDLPATC